MLLKIILENRDAILAKHRIPFKKIEEEKKQMVELKVKKKAKIAQKKLGHKSIVDWDKKSEKNLMKITTKELSSFLILFMILERKLGMRGT